MPATALTRKQLITSKKRSNADGTQQRKSRWAIWHKPLSSAVFFGGGTFLNFRIRESAPEPCHCNPAVGFWASPSLLWHPSSLGTSLELNLCSWRPYSIPILILMILFHWKKGKPGLETSQKWEGRKRRERKAGGEGGGLHLNSCGFMLTATACAPSVTKDYWLKTIMRMPPEVRAFFPMACFMLSSNDLLNSISPHQGATHRDTLRHCEFGCLLPKSFLIINSWRWDCFENIWSFIFIN